MKPFGLYPLMIHPVLPGETLQHAELKMRTLSKPIAHPLTGAWLETWTVYIKLTDLDRDLGQMFVSDTYSSTGYTAAADSQRYFTKAGQIDWVRLCTERFHTAYFLSGDEAATTIDGVPKVKLNAKSWYQNCIFRPAEVAIDTTDVFDTQTQMTAFEMMQQMSMSELTYEKYLQQFGVQSIRTAMGEPEILRYSRSWTLPTNTVDSSTGSPSSAWVWSDKQEASKPKRFSEPGFVMMFAAVRPKMFQKNLQASMVGNLWGFSDFFPIYNLAEPNAGVKSILTTDVVFDPSAHGASGARELFYDHKDLLSHGEQFVNTAWSGEHPYAIPGSNSLTNDDAALDADLRGEYANDADVDLLFTTPGTTTTTCFYEGIVGLRVSGHIKDTTL
jgi:hypothetical protein